MLLDVRPVICGLHWKAEKILQKHIDRIAAASGNTFMTDHHVPPHLTITSIQSREEEPVLVLMEELKAKNLHSAGIDIMSLGIFLPQVMYAAPFYTGSRHDYGNRIIQS